MTEQLSKYLRGVLSDYLTFGIGLVSNLVLVPLVISLAGTAAFGVWATIRSLVGYARLMDGGLSNAVPRFVAFHRAAGGDDSVKTVASTSFTAYMAIAAAVVLVSIVLSQTLGAIIDLEGVSLFDAGLAMLLAGLALAVRMMAAPLRGTIFGHERLDVVNLIESASLILQFILNVALLLLGLGIVGLALADLVATSAGALAFFLFVRAKIPHGLPALRRTDLSLMREILSFSGFVLLTALFMQVILNTDNIVIGRFVGVTAVAAFAIAFQLVDLSRKIVLKLGRALVPVYSRNDATGNTRMSSLVFTELSSASVAVGMLATIGLALFGGDVIALWVGPDNFVGWATLWVLCPFVFIQSVVVPGQVALLSVNRHRNVTVQRGLEALLNLILSLLLVQRFGVWGVAAATVIAATATTFWMMPRAVLRHFDIALVAYLRRILPNVAFGLVLFALSFLFVRDLVPRSVLGLAAASTIISLLYAAAYYFFFAGPLQRDLAARLAKGGVSRVRGLISFNATEA